MGNINVTPDIEIGVSTPVTPIDVLPSVDTADNCGCGTGCEIQGLEDAVNKPIGIAPTFIQPSVVLDGSLNPIVAIIGDTLNYKLDYTQNDGGIVDDVEVWIDDELVYVGGLTGSFTRVLSPGLHTATFEVTYGPGTVGQDSNGNPVPNPITGGTLTVSIAFNAIIPLYSGVGEVPVTFTNPQIQDLKLNTGTIETRFWLAIHNTLTLQTAEDSNAMYLDLKGIFVYYSTVSISGESYIVYRMVNAIPYKTSHKFEFHVN